MAQAALKRFSGIIPIKELIIDSCRASGKYVNKKDSRVSIAFHVQNASWMPEETKKTFAQIHRSNISQDGFLTIRSDKTSYQTLNIADCMDKLRAYIQEAEENIGKV